MPAYFNINKIIETKINEMGGSEGVPKYASFSDLPEVAEPGAIAIVMDEDYIYLYDELEGVWKVTGVRIEDGGGGGGTGDLTKEEADGYYAFKEHTHTEYLTEEEAGELYATKSHTHADIQERLDAIGNGMTFKAEVDTFADIPTVLEAGDTFVVSSDENKENRRSLYTFNGTELVYLGTFGISAGAKINDEVVATDTTYSSNKSVELFAPKNHTHTEYAEINHAHTEYAEIDDSFASTEKTYSSSKIGELIGNAGTGGSIDTTNLEKKILQIGDEEEIDLNENDLGKKFIQNGKLKYIDLVIEDEKRLPEQPITTAEQFSELGWTFAHSNFFTFSNAIFFPYALIGGGSYIRTAGTPAWFSYEFPEVKTLKSVELVFEHTSTNFDQYNAEYTENGVNWYPLNKTVTLAPNQKGTQILEANTASFKAKKIRVNVTVGGAQQYIAKFFINEIGASTKILKELDTTPFGFKKVELTAGEDAGVKIREALETNASVYIPEGTWNIDTMIRVPSNRNIKMHPLAVLKRNANIKSIFINDADGVTGAWDANENIHIEGGILDGNYEAFPDGEQRQTGLIVFAHAKNLSVRDTTFKNLDRWHMIEVNSSINVLIKDCLFKDYHNGGTHSSEAIQIDLSFEAGMPMVQPWDLTTSHEITIKDCRFENVKDAIGAHSAIAGRVQRKINIIDNVFKDLSGKAVKGLNWEDVTVEGNLLERCKGGIELVVNSANSGRVRVAKNKLFQIGYAGGYDDIANGISVSSPDANFKFNRVFIEDNIMSLIGKYGIIFNNSENVFVRGNSVQSINRTGIYSLGSKKAVISGNTVEGTNMGGYSKTQAIKIGDEAGGKGDKGIVVTQNRADTIGCENSDGVTIIHNIINANGTYFPATNTNFIQKENIVF